MCECTCSPGVWYAHHPTHAARILDAWCGWRQSRSCAYLRQQRHQPTLTLPQVRLVRPAVQPPCEFVLRSSSCAHDWLWWRGQS